MRLLDNKTPQVEFYNMNALILAGISTNKEVIVNMNGYGAISANDEAEIFLHCLLYICTIYITRRRGIEWKSIDIW